MGTAWPTKLCAEDGPATHWPRPSLMDTPPGHQLSLRLSVVTRTRTGFPDSRQLYRLQTAMQEDGPSSNSSTFQSLLGKDSTRSS